MTNVEKKPMTEIETLEKTLKQLRKKNLQETIYSLRLAGKTFVEIGNLYGKTREWARMMAKALPPEKWAQVRLKTRIVPVYNFNCLKCGKQFTSEKLIRKYCSHVCGKTAVQKYNYPASVKTAAQRINWLYHNSPEYHKRWEQHQKRYRAKVMADPVKKKHLYELTKIYVKRHLAKKKLLASK